MLSEDDEGISMGSALSVDGSGFKISEAICIFALVCPSFLEVSKADKSRLSEYVGSNEISMSLVIDSVLSESSVGDFLFRLSEVFPMG